MNQSEIEHMAQGLPPSVIGKDHEEVVIWLATQLLDVQKKLGVAIKRGDACMQAEMVWEKAMMAAIGEDGVGCVVKAIAALKAERDALAAENALIHSKPSLAAMMEALDAFYDHEDVPETGMLAAYEILLPKRLPLTDSYLNSVRAEGVDKAIEHLHEKFSSTGQIGVPVMALEWLSAQLRAGQEAK